MATMKEVAKRAGVSVATVSRVINNTAHVEPVTRERVESAMREYNYHRNAAALALAKRSGSMLGLLTGNLSDPFFSRLARAVEDSARKQGTQIMVCNGGHQAELEKSGLDFLINHGCEAIVAHITRMKDPDVLRYAAHTPGLVLINRYIPAMGNRCVWMDNVTASQTATDYLLQNGHVKIACITADLPIADKNYRLQGYLNAMENAGISVPPSWIISAPFTEEGGELAAEKMLTAGQSFTAVIAFNDVIAAGMMKRFHQDNIRMPGQISIMGFDDIVMARYLFPPLTTIHYPIEDMAERAAKIALMISNKQTIPPLNNQFIAKLIIRNSVSPR